MAKKKDQPIVVNSLADFIGAIHATQIEWEQADDAWLDPWFRGVSNADYGLLPGLYRPQWDQSREKYDLDEEDFRVDFKLKSIPYRRDLGGGNNDCPESHDWDEYCLMQHYGLPTRLIDWSESALVALHFALDSDSFENAPAHAAVWMFDPWWFNERMGHGDDLFFTWEKKGMSYLPPLYSGKNIPKEPLAILAPYNSPRITAQRGLFTVHGSDKRPLERIVGGNAPGNRLVQFLIPKNRMAAIRRQLRTAGVTPTSIYPDLAGLCSEAKRDWLDLPAIPAVGRASRKILGSKPRPGS
jgi:hypothetical protein